MTINISAPFCSSGYGQVALALLGAFDRRGDMPAAFSIGSMEVEPCQEELLKVSLERAKFFDPAAVSLRIYHQWLLAEHIGRGPRVALPIFELDTLTPVEKHHLDAQDLVVVPSEWARGVLESNGVLRVPTVVAPFGVDRTVFTATDLPESGPTVFAHIAKAELRKGIFEVIEAFHRAFTSRDDVRLVLHCHNPFMPASQQERYAREWQNAARRGPLADKITITSERFRTRAEVAALMAKAHCGLFPARAEGWNMELAEMLAMGRHVVCTDYSGHTEFVTGDCARLIPVTSLEAAYDGLYFHGQGNWAVFGPTEKECLIGHMRSIHRERLAGSLPLNQAGIDRMRAFTWEKTAALILRHFQS